MRYRRFGRRSKQGGATFLGMVTIGAILGLGLYAGIRLVPLYIEYFAVSRAITQAADSMKGGDSSATAIRSALARRWEVEDIKGVGVEDIEISKVANGIQLEAAYRAEAPFIANVSLVVDFEKTVVIGSGAAGP
jgi:hypothetical protein